MKVLIIGGGGREHTIAWKIAQSNRVDKVFVAPGNAGMTDGIECIDIKVNDFDGLMKFAVDNDIDLTVVGPEDPLVDGIVDVFEAKGLRIMGPNKKAAQFEGSKAFTKIFLEKHGIPTAKYKELYSSEEALKNLGIYGYPMVIKADGLAAGKGVVIAQNEVEAKNAIKEMMDNRVFGDSGDKIVIEEFLTGIEASVLCFVDGDTIVPMESAQDYKKALEGGKGLNTGGMGTYSPSAIFDDKMIERVQKEILDPFIVGTKADGIDFKGILFVGLMIEGDKIDVIEYNVRFGDPETQVVLPRMKSDLVDVFEAIVDRKLSEIKLEWLDESAVCVIVASGGYPESYTKGYKISGLDDVKDGVVFHSGTKFDNGDVVSNGGRVLGVVGTGANLDEAKAKAYENTAKVSFENSFYRKDIGEMIRR